MIDRTHDLERERERLSTIVENIPLMLAFVNADGRCELVNRAWSQDLGWNRYEMNEAGSPQSELLRRACAGEAATGGSPVGDPLGNVESTVTRNGDTREVRWATVRLENGGAVVIGDDITEQMNLEEQFRQAQKMEAVGRLAGGIAHDFNNLLVPILSYADLLAKRMSPESQERAFAAAISDAGERAAGLTRQILAFSRKQVLERRRLDMNEVVTGMESMLARLIEESIKLTVRPAPEPVLVSGDRSQIEQVLLNLGVNARDAMTEGGYLIITVSAVELDAAWTRKYIESVAPGPYVRVAVSDTGCGMSPEEKKQAFEPFFTTKEIGKGTGLGLSTVHGIVRQHGGDISVYSEIGMGTTFAVYLPRVGGKADQAGSEIVSSSMLGGPERILVVEDEDAVRQVVVDALEQRGYSVEAESDPEVVVERAASGETAPDLLVVDVVMPGLNGKELYERVSRTWSEIPVVYMSGYTEDEMMHHGVGGDEPHLVQKPFTMETLARAVRRALDRNPD